MPITTTTMGAQCVHLDVAGPMTVYEAGAHKTELLDALADGNALDIDLAGVDEIDTAGLQLLVLARREGLKAGKPVRLLAPSAAVLEAMGRYGLGSWLQDLGAVSTGPNVTKEST